LAALDCGRIDFVWVQEVEAWQNKKNAFLKGLSIQTPSQSHMEGFVYFRVVIFSIF
jgi:hypothetical protein